MKVFARLNRLVIAPALLGLMVACGEKPASNTGQTAGIPVKVAAVGSGVLDDSSEYVATLQSRRSVTLQPQVDGQVSAINVRARDDVVFVAQQDQAKLIAKQKPIKLGTIQGNSYQVLDGLKAGEKVVVSGVLKLSDGAAIVPET
ncbi:MAG: hypothetical protein HC866_26100 [Leptolyngbyaceae cyanobacterium RU_5_1]|nr:hypothetical protein [Leptolyngbyaceae cyanobacterium RU_5_1]